jgi:hypothetical protein
MRSKIIILTALIASSFAANAKEIRYKVYGTARMIAEDPDRPHFWTTTCPLSPLVCWYMWSDDSITIPGYGHWVSFRQISGTSVTVDIRERLSEDRQYE